MYRLIVKRKWKIEDVLFVENLFTVIRLVVATNFTLVQILLVGWFTAVRVVAVDL
jgi:hypothetical protein